MLASIGHGQEDWVAVDPSHVVERRKTDLGARFVVIDVELEDAEPLAEEALEEAEIVGVGGSRRD